MTKNKENEMAKKIKQAIKEAGLTQQKLADKLGITNPVVNTWTTGKRNPTANSLKRIARATKKDISYFFENSPIGNNNIVGNHNVLSPKDISEIILLRKDVEIIKKDIEILKLKLKK